MILKNGTKFPETIFSYHALRTKFALEHLVVLLFISLISDLWITMHNSRGGRFYSCLFCHEKNEVRIFSPKVSCKTNQYWAEGTTWQMVSNASQGHGRHFWMRSMEYVKQESYLRICPLPGPVFTVKIFVSTTQDGTVMQPCAKTFQIELPPHPLFPIGWKATFIPVTLNGLI